VRGLPRAAGRAGARDARRAAGPAPDPAARVRVVGIDTSLRCTGLAAIDAAGSRFEYVDCRPVPNPARLSLPECLVRIADALEAYLDEFRPDEIAMEGIFFCKNARTALILGHARGVVVATCARRGLPMHEYPPARVKRAVTGTGSATKDQMQRMMQRVFGLPDLPQEDSADALAIALAHVHERRVAALARGAGIPAGRALR
jgi:crossover junction endodeoxyribonuclease RuvC